MTRLRSGGLGARLMAAQLLVLLTAVVTVWFLTAAVGPSVFREHLGRTADTAAPDEVAVHAERAFRDASVISLGVALVAALLVALAVSAYVTRRITRPVAALAAAASDLAAGRHGISVPAPRLGSEFDSLTLSFDSMATKLHAVEVTRRRLLADLAHELRTPVATLDGYLEGVEDGVAQLDAATIDMLRSQTRRLTRLAEDVTAVSRAEEQQLDLHLAAASLEPLVHSAVSAVGERSPDSGVVVSAEVEPGLPQVQVDPERLGQVLANLLDNAVRHTPAGGTVQVRASAGHGEVVLEVVDTGRGIAPEHLPHVFERFYRVDAARDRSHGGSGIGLTIVQALVHAHRGRVTATSEGLGRGATFTVWLPAAAPS